MIARVALGPAAALAQADGEPAAFAPATWVLTSIGGEGLPAEVGAGRG